MFKYEETFNPSFLKKPSGGIPAPLPDDAAEGEKHLARYPKKSFSWFKKAFESNGEDLA